MRTNRPLILVALLSAVSAGAQTAPPPDPLAPVRSMGRPPVWKPFAGGYYGLDQSEEQARSGGAAFVGVYKDLLPSIVGVGASGEAYLGGYSGLAGVNGGVRALAELRGLFLKAGVDYDFQRDDASFILSLTVPLRRGGILGHGTHLRVDWLPGRGNSWNFGLQVPLEPHMGKTRPRDTEVDMPRAKKPRPRAPIDPAVVAAMQEVRTSARGIAVLSTAFWSDDRSDRVRSLERTRRQILEFKKLIGQTSPDRPNGVSMESEVRILHDRLDLAFGLAAGAGAAEARAKGAPVATAAREVALDEVLYPYNRLFGQYKRPEELWGLVAKARERFVARLDAAGLAGARRDAILDVFEDYLRVLEETREWWVKRLEADSRLAWLPFQLVLRDDQHDTQAEIDAIVSRAQGTPLVGGNTVHYWAAPAVPGRAAADDPRGRGLPRSLAARLRRRRRGRQPRRGRLLHQRRGLPEGAHAAGARVRPHREAARLHDPRRPQLLGGQPGPPLHRRAAGPARGPRAAAAPGGPGEPQAAGGDRPGAAGAARGGGRRRSGCRRRRPDAGRAGCGSTSPSTST